MTLRNTLAVSTVAMALLVAGCGAHYGDKELGGSLVGAGLGALAGSQVGSGKGKLAAVAVGALAGAFVGSDVGRSLDRADRLHAARGTQTALEGRPAGKTVTWRNPDSGNWGTVTPTRTYQTARGGACRDYESTIYVKGYPETAAGRACRQGDGVWHIVQ